MQVLVYAARARPAAEAELREREQVLRHYAVRGRERERSFGFQAVVQRMLKSIFTKRLKAITPI